MSDRVLVFDADLNPRLARELRNRGRRASSIEELRLKGALDPDVIAKVFAFFTDPVLVTGDDGMPAEHASNLTAVNATVAVVHPWDKETADIGSWEGQAHRTEDEWEAEIVHRWAHLIQEQRTGTIRRYAVNSYGDWKPRRKTRRRRSS
jgi:predicted nuclease of predicted toxin-antitoxin system